jgi:hypothetical protein
MKRPIGDGAPSPMGRAGMAGMLWLAYAVNVKLCSIVLK